MPRPFVCCATLLFCGIASAESLTPAQKKLNIDSFERVWTAVRDTYWDPKLGGLDWQAVHEELRPAIGKAETMTQARQLMSGMLERLHASHLRIIPLEAYKAVGDKTVSDEEGSAGMDVRIVNGQAVVTRIERDSPAANAGIRPGWRIMH